MHEYKVIEDNDQVEVELNELADEGWRVVHVIPPSPTSQFQTGTRSIAPTPSYAKLLFEREKPVDSTVTVMR